MKTCEFCGTELWKACWKMYSTYWGPAHCPDNFGHEGPCGEDPLEVAVRHTATDCRETLVLQRDALAAQLKEAQDDYGRIAATVERIVRPTPTHVARACHEDEDVCVGGGDHRFDTDLELDPRGNVGVCEKCGARDDLDGDEYDRGR